MGNQQLSSHAPTVELHSLTRNAHAAFNPAAIEEGYLALFILLVSIWILYAHNKPGVHKPDSGEGLNFKVATTQISIPD